jgi:tripartite-type tricarboxylate transporter receptor subunit TctC
MQRRLFLRMAWSAAAGGLLTHTGRTMAQSLAGKQIRLIVPFPAGGPTDIVARPLAQMLGDALKTVVLVDNRGGAGGSLGADAVAKSAADGQTLLMGTVGTHATIRLYTRISRTMPKRISRQSRWWRWRRSPSSCTRRSP